MKLITVYIKRFLESWATLMAKDNSNIINIEINRLPFMCLVLTFFQSLTCTTIWVSLSPLTSAMRNILVS